MTLLTTIVTYAVAITGALGLIVFLVMLAELLMSRLLRDINAFKSVIEYFWHRDAFRQWLKEQKEVTNGTD